ncbi:MAG: hypothetical protein Q8K89_02055, partial [Actinomycetota bacterium]|nr:hypothetical protein [Actinomycetota bacterium]
MRSLKRLMVLVAFVVATVPFAASPATAASVEPVTVAGNPKLCENGFRVDPGESGTYVYTHPDLGEITIEIVVRETAEGPLFDFTSSEFVARVVAKGGRQGANIYTYDPAVMSDTGLHAPMNPSGYWAGLSHIDFCFTTADDPPPPPLELGVVEGLKFYDRDMDGEWDATEPLLPGWKILISGDVPADFTFTDTGGAFYFDDLADGTFLISEALPIAPTCWVQTAPIGNVYEVIMPDDDGRSDLYFGNVCQVYPPGGYTLGYWSNKNGQAVLAANSPAWMSLLGGYNLVGANGSAFDPTSYAGFRTWLLKADATNMSYMLSVQMAATLLDIKYKGMDLTGLGVVIGGEWVSLADVISGANAFLAANPVTRDASAYRAEAEMYKNIF